MLLAFKMLLSLVFLSFNIYLLVDLPILPPLFLPWHFLFKAPECFPAVGKGKVCTLVCILAPLHRPSLTAAAQTQSFVALCARSFLPGPLLLLGLPQDSQPCQFVASIGQTQPQLCSRDVSSPSPLTIDYYGDLTLALQLLS